MQPTRVLAREGWSEYLDAVSKELVNAPVSIEVFATGSPPHFEATGLPLIGLSYDGRDDVLVVAAGRPGSHVPDVRRHLIDHPQRIDVDSHTMLAPMRIGVDGQDGVRSVISIDRDAELGR